MAISKDKLKDKDINNLYHFTNIDNLKSILSNGLMSRKELDNNQKDYKCNDEFRLDNQKNCISLSIEHPNYKMLHSIAPSLEEKKNMAILEIDANILTEEDRNIKCSVSNAARNNGEDIKNLNDNTFEELFYKTDRYENLYKKYPTDPQAEILIENDIDLSYIKKIFLYENNVEVHGKIDENLKNKIEVNKNKYSPRIDYKKWQKNE